MTRFAHILTIVAALALVLSPLAPVAAQCAGEDQEVVAAMPDMPCCPDEAPAAPVTCKTGCIQLPAVITVMVSEPARPEPVFVAAVTVEPVGWQVRPDPKPPRLRFLI